ncbi:MAG: LysR family transcriptional regulator [Pseudomonadales bacterium]|jgi:LysR family transcriptional regulator for metE and metH|nr:LysR family transcriptional regulator [Pseudomonadales bacterium]
MLNRIHLEILRAVRSEGSVSEAASKLHLTQSALSHSIRKLERYLGARLWTRQGRTLRLTRAGAILLTLAERALPDFEHAEQLIARLSSGQQGLLRIGMECHPCYEWLHRSIPSFIAAFEGVDIDVKRQFQFDGLTALLNHDIDVLITPDPVFKPRLKFVPVFSYELVLVCAREQALSARRYVEAAALADQVLYTYPVAKERLDVFSQFLLPANLEPREHKTLESTDIMLQMVAARRGVTALPDWLVKNYEPSLDLRCYHLGRKGVHKQLFLGIRVEDQSIPYVKGFIRLAKQVEVDPA